MAWKLEERTEGHTRVITLRGRPPHSAALAIVAAVRRAEPRQAIELRFSHASAEQDTLLPAVMSELREQGPLPPGLRLTGLTRHQRRLLAYLGVRLEGDRAPQ
jgi:hypothetical protein